MSKTNFIKHVEYRLVPGYPAYRVGDDGSVWSRWKRNNIHSFLSNEWIELKQCLTCTGYLYVGISNNGTKKRIRVHVLVLESFVGPRPDGYDARHLNDIKADNRLCNLAWGTRRQNIEDKARNGHLLYGESHGCAYLTEQMVKAIRLDAASGCHQKTISEKYNIPASTIQAIVRGTIWKHIPEIIPVTKLTKKEVLFLRKKCADGESIKQLAIAAKINQSTLRSIIRGYSYKNISGAVPPPLRRKRKACTKK